MSLMCFVPGWTYGFVYTNCKGEREPRKVRFRSLECGAIDLESGPVFFLNGIDLDRHKVRSFKIDRIEALSVRRVYAG